MTDRLSIRLFGNVDITFDGQPLANLGSRTAEALFFYLICHQQPLSRRFLADFFWDERNAKQAAANLRSVLSLLRKALGDFLIVTRETVAFDHQADYWLDTAVFEQRLAPFIHTDRHSLPRDDAAAAQLQEVVELYRGDFLAGFYLRESRGFEEWAVLTRERLGYQAALALQQLTAYFLANGRFLTGLPYGERLVVLDPYNEGARRQIMWLLARSGRLNAALKHYRELDSFLGEELHIAPSPATTAVYQRLRGLDFPPPLRLPLDHTPFVGREVELSHLELQLSAPTCRMLTIFGPGGMGKTRLATEAARRLHRGRPGQFLDGIFFCPLIHAPTADYLTTAVADALSFNFEGAEPSDRQLFAHLKTRELLLILDNFEHLISPESLAWLSRLLQEAQEVKLLVTSRERLRLVEEQLFDLQGLDYPVVDDSQSAAAYGAGRLFLQHARRVQADYKPPVQDLLAIAHLCRLVEGMPLGIELAAAGIRYSSVGEIVSQLTDRFSLSFGHLENRPERHQSLEAVFEHSWSLLSSAEQAIARRFAVFGGPFDAQAAMAVTQATGEQLILLHDKSFLQRLENGQFDLHPLLRQFLDTKLGSDPDASSAVRHRHSAYYHDLFRSTDAVNMEQVYHTIRDVMAANSDNAIAAALWAAEQHDFADRRLVGFIERLNFHFALSQRYEVWKVVFSQLIEALNKTPDGSYEERWLTTVLHSRIAYADYLLHAYPRARERLETVIPVARRLENGPLISASLQMLAELDFRAADFDAAFRHINEALSAAEDLAGHYRWPVLRGLGEIAMGAGRLNRALEAHQTAFELARAQNSHEEAAPVYHLSLGRIARRRGKLHEAAEEMERALEVAQHKRDRNEVANCLLHLGQVAVDVGDFSRAGRLLAEADQVAGQIGDSRLRAFVFLAQGWLAENQADLVGAQTLYQAGAERLLKIDDRASWPFGFAHLGRVSAALASSPKTLTEADSQLQQALEMFVAMGHDAGRALALIGLGQVRRGQEQPEAARDFLQQALAAAGQEYYTGLQAAAELALLLDALDDPAAPRLAGFLQAQEAVTFRNKERLAALSTAASSAAFGAVAWEPEKTVADLLADFLPSLD